MWSALVSSVEQNSTLVITGRIFLIYYITFQTRPTPQLCDVSFGCEPVNINKQKKRPTASAGVTTKMTSNESPRLDLDLPPLPSSLSVTNSLLPEIQPTYKPVRLPSEFCDGSPKKKKGTMKVLDYFNSMFLFK